MDERKMLYEMYNDIQNVKKALGRIEQRQCENNDYCLVNENEFKVYSQWGEDGIIQWLIKNVPIKREIFIEFGASDYEESNTRYLLENNNWAGLIMDGSKENIKHIKSSRYYWRYNLKAECAFITRENINDLIRDSGFVGDIGILSIDVDGNDYWIWEQIDEVNPRIVIVEYNSLFGPDAKITTPYLPDFVRQEYDYTYLVYGASISALVEMGERKGYVLVAGNKAGNNLFFVRKDLCNEKVKKVKIEDAYKKSMFREMRDVDGRLTYAAFEERQKAVEDVMVWNLEKKCSETLGQALGKM